MQYHLNRTPKLLYSEHLFISLIKSKVVYIEHYSVKTYSSSFASSISSFLCDLGKTFYFDPTSYLT